MSKGQSNRQAGHQDWPLRPRWSPLWSKSNQQGRSKVMEDPKVDILPIYSPFQYIQGWNPSSWVMDQTAKWQKPLWVVRNQAAYRQLQHHWHPKSLRREAGLALRRNRTKCAHLLTAQPLLDFMEQFYMKGSCHLTNTEGRLVTLLKANNLLRATFPRQI